MKKLILAFTAGLLIGVSSSVMIGAKPVPAKVNKSAVSVTKVDNVSSNIITLKAKAKVKTTNKTKKAQISTTMRSTIATTTTKKSTTTQKKKTTTTKKKTTTTTTANRTNTATYSARQFKRLGVVRWGGRRWTWYSERVLPGRGLRIPGRHKDSNGYVCDENGYICLASCDLSKGTVINTPFGKKGKIYDYCPISGTIDVYVGW